MNEGIFSTPSLPSGVVEFCVVSDIHIANDEPSSRAFTNQARNDYVFAKNKTQSPISGEAYTLKRFCEKINYSGRLGNFDDGRHKLILLGDIVNGECGYFSSYKSAAYKMLSASFLPWVHTGNIIYVCGNHDKEAKFYSVMTNIPRKFIYENGYSEAGVEFRHGHEFDFLCNGRNVLGMMGDFASSAVVKLFSPYVEDLMRGRQFRHDKSDLNKVPDLRGLPSQATLQNMSGEAKRVAQNAIEYLSKYGSSHTIVCGHTHQSPVRIDIRDKHYINSGKFAKNGYINVRSKLRYPELGVWELV